MTDQPRNPDQTQTRGRCQALQDRGLCRGAAVDLYFAGNLDAIADLEAATDADLAAVSRAWEARESAVADVEIPECRWVECDQTGPHTHPDVFRWVNPGDPMAGEVRVLVKPDGTVTMSEPALAQLLSDAGWERTA